MKSIATELVNNWDMHISSILVIKAKQHALTCQTILDLEKSLIESKIKTCGSPVEFKIFSWCENEIKILKDGGLI